MPVPNAIAHRIEGQLAFEVLRSRRRRRQHGLCCKLPLVEVQKTQIKIQVWLSVLDSGGDASQYVRRLLLFASTLQRNVKPVRTIDQAVVCLRQGPGLAERNRGLVELA